MQITEHFDTIAGIKTYYQTAGAGRPVVLLHGVGGSSVTFRSNIADLARQFRVFAIDLPGHGRSEKPDLPYHVEEAVPFLKTFITDVVGGPAALVGVSAGGLMCALTAAAHPKLVSHLVLVSSAGIGRDVDWGLRLLSLPIVRPWLENGRQDPAAVRMSLKRVVHDPALITDELVETVCEERRQPGHGRATYYALRNNLGIFGLRRWRHHMAAMKAIDAPIMVIWGRQDKFIPVRHAYRAMRWFTDAPVHILDGCGHWPPFERPVEFNSLVSGFLTPAPLLKAG